MKIWKSIASGVVGALASWVVLFYVSLAALGNSESGIGLIAAATIVFAVIAIVLIALASGRKPKRLITTGSAKQQTTEVEFNQTVTSYKLVRANTAAGYFVGYVLVFPQIYAVGDLELLWLIAPFFLVGLALFVLLTIKSHKLQIQVADRDTVEFSAKTAKVELLGICTIIVLIAVWPVLLFIGLPASQTRWEENMMDRAVEKVRQKEDAKPPEQRAAEDAEKQRKADIEQREANSVLSADWTVAHLVTDPTLKLKYPSSWGEMTQTKENKVSISNKTVAWIIVKFSSVKTPTLIIHDDYFYGDETKSYVEGFASVEAKDTAYSLSVNLTDADHPVLCNPEIKQRYCEAGEFKADFAELAKSFSEQ